MILRIKTEQKDLFRTVTRLNTIKVAKSIHKEFPNSDYAALLAIIRNAVDKRMNSLTIFSKDL